MPGAGRPSPKLWQWNVSRHSQYLLGAKLPLFKNQSTKEKAVETLTIHVRWTLGLRTKLKSQRLSLQHLAVRCVGCCPLCVVLLWGWGNRSILYGTLGLTRRFPAVRVVPRWNEWPQEGWSPLMGQAGYLLLAPPEPSSSFSALLCAQSLTCRDCVNEPAPLPSGV